MNFRGIFFVVLAFGLTSVKARATDTLSISGVSAGGYFAQQFHVAHSSWVKGVGIIAAGPYACAKNGLMDAFYRCMEIKLGIPEAQDSLNEMKVQARLRSIDPLVNLADAKIYLLSGTRDATVSPQVVVALSQLYQAVGAQQTFERGLEVGHAFPTLNYGNDCREVSKPPYLSSCGRDVAGEILKNNLGALLPPKTAQRSQLFRFSQSRLAEFPNLGKISMAEEGFAYVPANCRPLGTKDCRVHVAFHGCRQTTDLIGDLFITKTGYNNWAESNDLIIVYPQTIRSNLLGNPRGCWDWWGYTGPFYYTKAAPQIQVVSKLARAFMRNQVKLLPLKPTQE